MKLEDLHPSDEQLLQEIDGELSPHDGKLIRTHLYACWKCRVRHHDLENAITNFVDFHQRELDKKLPSAAPPRALLKAQIGYLSATDSNIRSNCFLLSSRWTWTLAATACGLLALSAFLARLDARRQRPSGVLAAAITIPDSRLTPGATLLVSRWQVCRQANTKNRTVPVALQRQVFKEYGLTDADPGAYEVDYLVTPALGGADDIHNLWPQAYSTIWNAHVKDALEDRLREMVCDGSHDLAEAQQEIAVDWIAAYKKHFHTDMPLAEHSR